MTTTLDLGLSEEQQEALAWARTISDDDTSTDATRTEATRAEQHLADLAVHLAARLAVAMRSLADMSGPVHDDGFPDYLTAGDPDAKQVRVTLDGKPVLRGVAADRREGWVRVSETADGQRRYRILRGTVEFVSMAEWDRLRAEHNV